MNRSLHIRLSIFLVLALAGCSSETPSHPPASVSSSSAALPDVSQGDAAREPAASAAPLELPSISLGGVNASAGAAAAPTSAKGADRRQSLLDAMMPLQIMLGKWRGTTQKDVGRFKAVDEPEWIWDFRTDRDQPVMVMTSGEGHYIREARLTYLTDRNVYRLHTRDQEGRERTLEGDFSEPVEEYQGDDNKLHRKYKLELTEIEPADPKDQWRIVFNQQENNRYLLHLSRQRGSRFALFDTVGTQRQGTSFALNDEDYGERKCIISGGLGTIQVSYQGKSYWVCCTGCQAAFNDDPAGWIADSEAQ